MKSVVFKKQIALPQDHGSWVFLLSPLLIGLFAGDQLTVGSILVIIGAMAAFLIRQPITIILKVLSGRRNRRDISPAIIWGFLYGIVGLAAVALLILTGYGYVLFLAIPGLPVFAWHLYLVSRRAERRQAGIEIVASGVLALAAPAAYWVGSEGYSTTGWQLFALTWLQSAASIVYAYLRLEQRELKAIPKIKTRIAMGSRSLLYTTFNLMTITILAYFKILPILIPFPYLLQWVETIWGTFYPAVGLKPTQIGIRQLIVSSLFTILFIFTWNLG